MLLGEEQYETRDHNQSTRAGRSSTARPDNVIRSHCLESRSGSIRSHGTSPLVWNNRRYARNRARGNLSWDGERGPEMRSNMPSNEPLNQAHRLEAGSAKSLSGVHSDRIVPVCRGNADRSIGSHHADGGNFIVFLLAPLAPDRQL